MIEKSSFEARSKAAAKISSAWNRLKKQKTAKEEQIVKEASADPTYDFAVDLYPQAGQALKQSESLAAKLTNIMGSTIVQNSLDLQYILDKLRLLTNRHLALTDLLKSALVVVKPIAVPSLLEEWTTETLKMTSEIDAKLT